MTFLPNILRMNAASCIAFGLMFIAIPDTVRFYLSDQNAAPSLVIMTLGAGLLLNGMHLLYAAQLTPPPPRLVRYFSTGDFIWVGVSLVLIATGQWIQSIGGIIITLLVALMVGTFGLLQRRHLNQPA